MKFNDFDKIVGIFVKLTTCKYVWIMTNYNGINGLNISYRTFEVLVLLSSKKNMWQETRRCLNCWLMLFVMSKTDEI